MTITATNAIGRPSGLIAPSRSTARSRSASELEQLLRAIRFHLLGSYVVRRRAEEVLAELETVRTEASFVGWNGYGGRPMLPAAYQQARQFLQALPTTSPMPEIGVDSEGEVTLDWVFGHKSALTVSVGGAGRCTFAWIRGLRTQRGTEWLDNDGIPSPIVSALSQLVREAGPEQANRR